MNIPGNFVIRVYGVIVNESREVLLSEEFQLGMKMPGGCSSLVIQVLSDRGNSRTNL